MKLKRYISNSNYDSNGIPTIKFLESDQGNLVFYSDIKKLEEENAALHAECDRLMAMIEEPKK